MRRWRVAVLMPLPAPQEGARLAPSYVTLVTVYCLARSHPGWSWRPLCVVLICKSLVMDGAACLLCVRGPDICLTCGTHICSVDHLEVGLVGFSSWILHPGLLADTGSSSIFFHSRCSFFFLIVCFEVHRLLLSFPFSLFPFPPLPFPSLPVFSFPYL